MNHTPSGYVIDVSSADFAEKVIQASYEVPVIVDFWAPWGQA
jgi:putative thioredoxin